MLMLVNYPHRTVKIAKFSIYSNRTVMIMDLQDKTQLNSLKYNLWGGTITPDYKNDMTDFFFPVLSQFQ